MATAPSLSPYRNEVDPGPYGSDGHSAWLDIDWREHQRWVKVRGRNVNVIELGHGPPGLLVHGHSGSWHNWLENIPPLAERHRVIAPDLPGFGASEMVDGDVTIERFARDMAELCDVLDVRDAPVIGNSM